MPSELEETLAPGPLAEAVARLALDKARAVAARVREGIVLGADTVVAIDGEALGKPASPADNWEFRKECGLENSAREHARRNRAGADDRFAALGFA